MSLYVLKFGGTSMATAQTRQACARLIRSRQAAGRVVAVVSALDGVTEILDDVARAAAGSNRRAVHQGLTDLHARHGEAGAALLRELETVLAGLTALGELTPRSRDLVLSFGERLAAPMLAAELGGDAVALDGKAAGIVTDERWNEASPLREVTNHNLRERVRPLLEQGRIPVITGFLGATQHGAVTTLGRGGSDFTATLVGVALGASEIWLCSDVDGLRAADPRLVPQAAGLAGITFAEALEMVQFGAKGIHPRALEPAAEQGIPVRIRNTFQPEAPGTLVSRSGEPARQGVRSIHLVKDVSMLTVAGAAMVGRPGTAARIFQTIAEAGGNVRMISQSVSEAGISVALARKELNGVRAALEGALVRPGLVRHVAVAEDVAIIAIVGEAMRGTPGVAGRVFGAMGKAGISVAAIAQGSSELSISFIVEAAKGPEAVRALYAELI